MINLEINKVKDFEWVDNSSLETYQKCPRAFFWKRVAHVVLSVTPIALSNGKAYHEALAEWHLKGKNSLPALKLFAEEYSKIPNPDKKRNVDTGVSTLSDYFHYYEKEEYETVEVEVGFAIEIQGFQGNEPPFCFVGRIDRLIKSPIYGLMPLESKTTTHNPNLWMNKLKPNFQLDGQIAGVMAITGKLPYGAIVDVIHVHESVAKRERPVRYLTNRSEAEIEHWALNTSAWFADIRHASAKQYYRQSNECQPYFGGECEYSILCKKYPNPTRLDIKTIELPEHYRIEKWYPFDELKPVVKEIK